MERIKNYFKNNKIKVLLYISIILLLTLILSVSVFIETLRIFLLLPICLLVGIGFLSFFKSIFPINNIFTFLVLSFLLGLFLNTSIVFLLGTLGLGIGYSFFIIYLPIVALFNLLLYLKIMKEEKIKDYIKKLKPDVVHIIWFLIFSLFIFGFFSIGFENYFLGWDGFSFWAIDSKYIFENGLLRDNSLDILIGSYLSFYPIQLNFIYLLYGKVVEQHASMLTLLYCFSAISLLYSYILDIKKSFLLKSFLLFIVWVSLYIWFTIHHVIFNQYADIFCSVLALMFGVVLFNKPQNLDKKSYLKRLTMLLLIAISFYLTKLSYSIITAFLIGSIFIYDIRYIYNNFLKRSGWVLVIPAFIFLCVILYLIFIKKIFDLGIISFAFENFALKGTGRFHYLLEMTEFLFSQIYLFLVPSISFFIAVFFFKGKFNYRDIRNLIFVLCLALIPLLFCIIRLHTFEDQSILRYFGIIYFLVPYFFISIFSPIRVKSLPQEIIGIILTISIPLIIFFTTAIQWNIDLSFNPHSGSYKDQAFLNKYYLISEEIRKIIPENSKIMIVDKEFEGLGNSRVPSMYLRYFLSEFSVGRQHHTFIHTWYPFMKEINPDYVLTLEYDNYWESCNGILREGSIYLVEMNVGHKDLTESDCFFELDDIVEF